MADLHPDVRAVLEDRDELPDKNELSPEAAREQHLDGVAGIGSPPVGNVEDRTIQGPGGPIPVRIYRPEGEPPFPTLVYIHGGGWVLGNLDTVDPVCRTLANSAGCVVVSVEYRLAPEHPFPAAVEDCIAAVEWASQHATRIGGDPGRFAVAGDSAGGNLAAVVALQARDRGGPRIDRQVLIYPVTDDDTERESYEVCADEFGLTRAEMRWFHEQYLSSAVHARNPYAFPLKACDLSSLPPATVITAEYDPLRDEGITYAERLKEAGVPVTHRTFEGMIHGFVGMLHEPDLDAAREAVDLIADGLATSFER